MLMSLEILLRFEVQNQVVFQYDNIGLGTNDTERASIFYILFMPEHLECTQYEK